jgi:hypothetical protein
MKLPSLGIAQHFADKIDQVLDLGVGIQLPSFDDDCHTNSISYCQYVKLQVFVGFRGHQSGWSSQIFLQVFEGLLCLFGPLELVLFFKKFEDREPPNAEL